jgi:hypothetical protein
VDYVNDDVDDESEVIKGIKTKRMSNSVIDNGGEEESTDDGLQFPNDEVEGKIN